MLCVVVVVACVVSPCVLAIRAHVAGIHGDVLNRDTEGILNVHTVPPSPTTHRHTHQTQHQRNIHHTETDRKREERWRKRREKRRDGEERGKNNVLTCTRGGMYMSVSLCSSFFHKKTHSGTRAFRDVLFKDFDLPQWFHVFASRGCFKHLFRFQARLYLFLKEVGREIWKSAWNNYEKKKHNTFVEGQKLRTAHIMDNKCSRRRFSLGNEQTVTRFLLPSALLDKPVECQLSWGTLRRESATGWFGLSLAPFSKHNERFARQYRYSTKVSPDVALLKLSSPYVGSWKTKTLYLYIYIFVYDHKISLYRKIFVFIKNMSSWIVKDTSTFEMELCWCRQATAHAHVQSHCMWLNPEHTKNSNHQKQIPQRHKSNSNLLINSEIVRITSVGIVIVDNPVISVCSLINLSIVRNNCSADFEDWFLTDRKFNK